MKMYTYLQTIPKGKVVTYGQIARHLGNKGLARVVGNILHVNPEPDVYPCYKVVNAQGRLAPNFGFGGPEEQKRRLEADGIEVKENKVDLTKYQWKPQP
jgi:O-6-methylguanine DNA methyltransferase